MKDQSSPTRAQATVRRGGSGGENEEPQPVTKEGDQIDRKAVADVWSRRLVQSRKSLLTAADCVYRMIPK